MIILAQLPFPILPEEPRHLSPPLGLAYMAASLGTADLEYVILDSVLEGYHEVWEFAPGRLAYGLNPESVAKRCAELGPEVVGLSCLFSTQDAILRLVVAALRRRLPYTAIVLGGTHPTVFAKEFVAEGLADFVVRGEGEHAVVDLAQALAGDKDFDQVSGLVWREGSRIRENAVVRVDPLDDLPLPARQDLDLAAYSRAGIMHGESPSDVPTTTIVTSRGCPARCTFCSIHPIWGHRFRTVSAGRVVAEISELYHRYGIRHLLVEDDNFTFDRARAKEILRTMATDFPDLSWSAPNGVAIWRLDEELVELIARTRCLRLSLAVESGSPDTLQRIIDKPLSLDQVKKTVRLCRKYGLQTTAFFVLGMPGETRAAMVESMDFAAKLDVDTITVMTAVPLPGSPLYDSALAGGHVPRDLAFADLTTRSPVLTTADFDPEWVDRLARKTMMRHALRHPSAYLRRTVEKVRAAPLSTLKAASRVLAATVRVGG